MVPNLVKRSLPYLELWIISSENLNIFECHFIIKRMQYMALLTPRMVLKNPPRMGVVCCYLLFFIWVYTVTLSYRASKISEYFFSRYDILAISVNWFSCIFRLFTWIKESGSKQAHIPILQWLDKVLAQFI
jgi:hypothetical protein